VAERQLTPAERVTKDDGVKFMPVYLGELNKDGTIIQLSQREERFVSCFTKTLSVEEASKEIGVSKESGKRYLKRPNIRKLLNHMIEKAAIRQGTDLDETIMWMRKARDGVFVPSEVQVKCAKELVKIFKPASAGISVNVNTQVNTFESPYKGMSSADLEKSMKERLDGIQGGNPSPA